MSHAKGYHLALFCRHRFPTTPSNGPDGYRPRGYTLDPGKRPDCLVDYLQPGPKISQQFIYVEHGKIVCLMPPGLNLPDA